MIGRQWLKSPIGLVRLSKAAGNVNYMANLHDSHPDNNSNADKDGKVMPTRTEMVLLPNDMRAPMVINSKQNVT